MDRIKLVVTDLDKTLLHDNLTLSMETIMCFHQLRQKGILTAIASTRPSISIKPYSDVLKVNYVISCGGSLIESDGKVIISNTMLPDIVANMISNLKKQFRIIRVSVLTDKGDTFWDSNELLHPDKVIPLFNDFHLPLKDAIVKLIIELLDISDINKIRMVFPKYEITGYRGENWCRIANLNSTKEFAISEIAKMNRIKDSEIVCFGDDYSDVGMLRRFIGIATSNAINIAREVAQYITYSNNDDGVAQFINENWRFK